MANSFIKLQRAKAQTHLLDERRRFSSSYLSNLFVAAHRPPANLSVTCTRESRSTANCQIRTQSQVSQVVVTATFSGTSANAGPHYQKLYARVTHIWGNHKGQPSPSAMKGPRLERTASLITFFFFFFAKRGQLPSRLFTFV